MTKPDYRPLDHNTVSPYLVVHGVPGLLEFMRHAFGAQELHRTATPDGTVRHAEARIGDTVIMMGEATAEFPPRPAMLHVYVPDADAVYRRALEAGAISLREPSDQFYGDRTGGVQDAFGNQWWMATHKEDVSDDEIARRMAAAMR
jgi:PhnB protein